MQNDIWLKWLIMLASIAGLLWLIEYWDSAAGLVTSVASSNTKLGVAVESVAAGTGTVKVRLSGAL